MNPLLERIQAQIAQLENRERLVLLVGALFVFIALFYFGLWKPIADENANLVQTNRVNQETLAWMKASVDEVKQLQQKAGDASAFGGSLLSLVDATTKSSGLAGQVKRIEPSGQDRVRVWLEQASFDQTMDWLQDIAKKGVSIEEVSIDADPAPGRIGARITLIGSFSK